MTLPNPDECFSSFLNRRRIEIGLTQLDLGATIGVALGTIGAWERGRRPHKVDAPSLSKALKVDSVFMHDLLERSTGYPRLIRGVYRYNHTSGQLSRWADDWLEIRANASGDIYLRLADRWCCSLEQVRGRLSFLKKKGYIKSAYHRPPPYALCKNGHSLEGNNVLKRGKRRCCRLCRNKYAREYKAKRKTEN